MALLYDVSYWSLKTRKRLAGCDGDVPIGHKFKAPAGELAHCSCTNGGRDEFWVDERGEVVPQPAWYGRTPR